MERLLVSERALVQRLLFYFPHVPISSLHHRLFSSPYLFRVGYSHLIEIHLHCDFFESCLIEAKMPSLSVCESVMESERRRSGCCFCLCFCFPFPNEEALCDDRSYTATDHRHRDLSQLLALPPDRYHLGCL